MRSARGEGAVNAQLAAQIRSLNPHIHLHAWTHVCECTFLEPAYASTHMDTFTHLQRSLGGRVLELFPSACSARLASRLLDALHCRAWPLRGIRSTKCTPATCPHLAHPPDLAASSFLRLTCGVVFVLMYSVITVVKSGFTAHRVTDAHIRQTLWIDTARRTGAATEPQ